MAEGEKEAIVEAENGLHAAVGQKVRVAIPTSAFLTGTLFLYMFPLAGLFGAAFYLAGQQVSAGIFIAFLAAYAAFQSAFTGLSRSVLSLFAALPYLERAKPLLTAETEQRSGAADPGRLEGAIQISQVSFAYNPGIGGDTSAPRHPPQPSDRHSSRPAVPFSRAL